jgi:hypothetical protein
MTTRNWTILSLFIVALGAGSAHANRQQVWYDDSFRPFSADQSQQDFVRVIQQTLREYELHSQGAGIFEWRGVMVNPPCGGGNNVRIMWDPSLPSNICAQTTYYAPFAVCPTGQITFNPAFAWRAKWSPNANDVCVSFQATLMHEMAHWMKQVGNGGHLNDSVLTQVGFARDLISRHLWNSDTNGINFGDPIFRITFPAHTFTWKTDWYDTNNGNSGLMGKGLGSPLGFFPTESFAPGANGQQYAMAWGSPTGIRFAQGDGRGFGAPVNLIGGTNRRVCVATNTGRDVFVAWADLAQATPSSGGNPFDGSRAIVFTQSHDGGSTWSAAANIPGAFTRAGVSCAFDPTGNKIVLAYQGSGEEGLWLTSRSPASLDPNGWSWPVMLSGPRTAETPSITFDPFAGTSSGWLAWHESLTGLHSIRRIGWNGSGYAFIGAAQPAVPGSSVITRSSSVAHMGNGTVHVLQSVNDSATTQVQRRTRGHESGFLTNADTVEVAPPSDLGRYSGAAENTLFIETLLGSHMLQGPN